MLTITAIFANTTSGFSGRVFPGGVEWPPSPARLLTALMSVSDSRPEYLDALRELEEAPHPRIIAAPASATPPVDAFSYALPYDPPGAHANKTSLPAGTKKAVAHAKSTQYEEYDSMFLSDPTVTYVVDCVDHLQPLLDDLCGRVPYLGRSTNHVSLTCSVTPTLPEVPPTHQLLSPILDPKGSHRGWRPGLTDAFEDRWVALTQYHIPHPYPQHAHTPLTYAPTPSRSSEHLSIPLYETKPASKLAPMMRKATEVVSGMDARVYPLTSGHSGLLVGYGVAGPDAPHAAVTLMNTRGLSTSKSPNAPYWCVTDLYSTPSTVFRSNTAMLCCGDVRLAEVTARVFTRRATGVDPSSVRVVKARPDTPGVAHSPGGPAGDYWWVEVQFPSPVSGPFSLDPSGTPGLGNMVPA